MAGRYPEIPEGGFKERVGFENWLNRLDEETRIAIAPVLAARIAACAIVYVAADLRGDNFSHFMLTVFRANAIARVAYKYPHREIAVAAAAAVAAATNNLTIAYAAAAAAAVDEAADSYTFAAAAHDAAAFAAASAATAAAARISVSDVWRALSDDVRALSGGETPQILIDKPLWLSGAPDWWLEEFERLKRALGAQPTISADGWQVWIGWLQCRVDGVPSWQLPEEKARRIEERIALGDGRADFWEREPDAINAEIVRWLADPLLYDKPERVQRPATKTGAETKPARKKPVPKTKGTSRPDDATITISISENAIADTESATTPEVSAQGADIQPDAKRTDLKPLADTVDGSADHLGRANIAYALAGRINEVWDQMNRSDGKATGAAPGFVIHIDAPWGGGKSTFAEYVAQILNPYRIEGELPDWLKALPMGDAGAWPERFRLPWHIVRFNAWQHQHVTPPWWVFYETIRDGCTKATGVDANQRDDSFPQPLVEFGYRSALMQRWKAVELRIREYVWRFATPTILINTGISVFAILLLWFLTSLGLFTFDLEKGAAPITAAGDAAKAAKDAAASSDKGGLGLIPSLLVTLFGGGAAVWKIVSAFSASLVPGTPDAAKNYSLGSGDPLKRMRKHFVAMMEQIHRPVLVIVDDLDRCDPGFVVELVRGMQTILASPRVVYLLLGDRDWIEQSFTEVHKAMKGVEVGPEHRFGGRFVEKAIQFSMVLPDVSDEGRRDYVRQILSEGRSQETQDEPVSAPTSVLESVIVPESQKQAVEAFKAATKAVLETDDYERREEEAMKLADKYDLLDAISVSRTEFEQEMAQKLFYRAATDKTARKATQHMIEGMASILPPNPRQIKRIINTLSLLGQVLRIKDPAKRPGSQDWQLLARWVVLMVEWPRSWFTLTRHPGLADLALAMKQGRDGDIDAIEKDMAARGFLPAVGARALAKLIAANPTVMLALDFQAGRDGQDSDWVKKPITADEIKWLRAVMPAASGQVLQPPQQEKAASSDPAAGGKGG